MVLIALNDKSHQKPLTWNKISTPKINMLQPSTQNPSVFLLWCKDLTFC